MPLQLRAGKGSSFESWIVPALAFIGRPRFFETSPGDESAQHDHPLTHPVDVRDRSPDVLGSFGRGQHRFLAFHRGGHRGTGSTATWLGLRGLVTIFGKLMDALTDKIMVMGLVIAFVGRPHGVQTITIPLALITLCREFLVTGMRMVAAAKGVIVAADAGGKSKTVTQLIALGFLLAAPMVRVDWAYLAGHELTGFADVVSEIGVVIFWIGTGLAVWSGWRYLVQFKAVVLDAADQ